jgi:hypothetical protein
MCKENNSSPTPLLPSLQEFLLQDATLCLQKVRVEKYQGSGNGGQKRNRVYSGVRLYAQEWNLQVSCCMHREALKNQHEAVHLLKKKLALEFRHPAPETVQFPGSNGHLNSRNPIYFWWLKQALDIMEQCNWNPALASPRLHISSTRLIRLFFADKEVKTLIQKQRQMIGAHPLKD